jgi:hypothetical protein
VVSWSWAQNEDIVGSNTLLLWAEAADSESRSCGFKNSVEVKCTRVQYQIPLQKGSLVQTGYSLKHSVVVSETTLHSEDPRLSKTKTHYVSYQPPKDPGSWYKTKHDTALLVLHYHVQALTTCVHWDNLWTFAWTNICVQPKKASISFHTSKKLVYTVSQRQTW